MNKILLLLLPALLFLTFSAHSQKPDCKKHFLVAFYNVENLFDTINNPNTRDDEFTPGGKKHWNSDRYWDKIEKLSRVLSSYERSLPEVYGLCEIENRRVVEDLINSPQLKKGKYAIVHHQSPDFRGIDVALVYRPKTFKLLYEHAYAVKIPGNTKFTTRDVLYVKLLHKKSKDTLHLLVNHWPSRRGGQLKSEPKRAWAARVNRTIKDSILQANPRAKILIMGDLNDEPADMAPYRVLRALPPDSLLAPDSLYNLAWPIQQGGLGSYAYRRQWNMLDNVIVSGNILLPGRGLFIPDRSISLASHNWLMYTDKQGNKSPSRTYGRFYYGGFSDHLSVYVKIFYRCK